MSRMSNSSAAETPVRPNVLRMRPYEPGKPIATVKRELGLDHVVKLASNENPFGPSPKAIEALKSAADELNLYPDGAAFDLRAALSDRYSIPTGQVLVGNGSEELIANIGLALLQGPEDEVLTSELSFPRYDAAAEIAPCKLVKIPLDSSWRFDLPALARAITPRTRIVYIANPNNPTGTIVRRREVEAFLTDVPESVLVVFDEAYYEFAEAQADYPNGLDYVKRGFNAVSLRTFSKAYGLAGIRAGYGFAPEYLVRAIERVRAPFDMNSLAQAAAVAAIGDAEHVDRTVSNNSAELVRVGSALVGLGCSVAESFANFHFVDVGRSGAAVFDGLLRKGYIVRPIHVAPNHIRVTIGTPSDNDGFLTALREVLTSS